MSLQQAVCSARLHQIRLLLDIGVNPDILDSEGRTPLMLAACLSKELLAVRIARLLLNRGARVECIDRNRRTALSYACQHGHGRLVKMLIDDEYDINMADKEGNTPLMYAAISGQVNTLREVLHAVLKYRLSVDLRNNKGFSAYLLAAKTANSECAQVLKREGNASDCVRDTEFFLSDKEWAKRVRRNFDMETFNKSISRTDNQPRPKTSPQELGRGHSLARVTSCNPRTISRLTTRSEPATRKIGTVNIWFPNGEEEAEKDCNGVYSASTFSTSKQTIPPKARTHTPNLHDIFSQYVLADSRPAVTVGDRRWKYSVSPQKHLDSQSRPAFRESRISRLGALGRKKTDSVVK